MSTEQSTRIKPRISLTHIFINRTPVWLQVWKCASSKYAAYGITPDSAYQNWFELYQQLELKHDE